MNASEFRDMSNEDLAQALAEAKEERFNLRFQVATNQLDNTARLKTVKKDIARMIRPCCVSASWRRANGARRVPR
jgi:large subunit ribosomal protein L29